MRPAQRPQTIPPNPSPPRNAISTVMTYQVVAPNSQPIIRVQTALSIKPEAPDAANAMMTTRYSHRLASSFSEDGVAISFN